MATLTLRSQKGSPLTNQEVDDNFSNLNSSKVETVTATSPVASSGGTAPVISLSDGYGDTKNPYASKTANYVLAAPNGSNGVPSFRALVAGDIPTLNQNTTGSAASLSATLAVSKGGTGQTTYTNGQLLIGNTTGNTLTKATLTAGTGISITNGTGSITIASTVTGTVTSVSGTGTVSGLTLTGTVTGSGSLTLGGTLSLTSAQVTGALGYTPYNSSNPSGYITGYTETDTLATVTARGATTTTDITINKSGGGQVYLGRTHSEGGEIRLVSVGGDTGGWIQGHSGGVRTVDHSWTQTTWNIDNAGNSVATASHRAPVFYDSNNTGYYVDPASTGTALNINGGISTPTMWVNYSTGNYNGYNENIRLYPAGNNVSVIAFGASGTSGTPWNSVLGFSSYFEIRQGDQWELRSYADYVEAYGSFRAPIFYDSNNTGYYLDPNSGGTALNIAGNIIQGNGGSDTGLAIYHGAGAGDYGRIRFYQAGSNNQTIHVFPTTWQGGTLAGHSAGAINLNGANGVTFGAWNSVAAYIGNSGDFWTRLSIQAPVGTFTNDGSSRVLYLKGSGNIIQFQDADGTNRWENVGRNGTYYVYKGYGTGSGYKFQINDSGDLTLNNGSSTTISTSKLYISLATPSGAQAVNSAASVVIDNTGNNFLQFRNSADNNSYQGLLFSDNNQGGYVVFGNAGGAGDMLRLGGYNSISFDVGTDDSTSSVALRTQRGYIDSSSNLFAFGSMRSPIFYDSNDTSYYVDPNGTARLNDIYPNQIYNYGWFRNQSSAAGLYNTANDAHFYSAGNNYWHINGNSGDITTGGLVFYDQYNSSQGGSTGRRGSIYWDSNGFGLLNEGWSWSINLHRTNFKRITLGGSPGDNPYSSVDGIRLMFGGGDDNAAGNYYIGTNFENYGGNYTKLDLRWHTGIRMGAQAGYGGIRFYDSEALGTQIFAIGKDGSYAQANQSMRAPIFYDLDDTNYYVDPNSTSITNVLRANSILSPNAQTVVAADSAMPNTGGSFIHTLALGPGGNDGHIMGMTWASTTSVYGAQLWLDTDPTNLMALRSRSSGGTWNAWSYVITDWSNDQTKSGYFQSNSSLRAPIFYDSNDTAYYADPNGSSRFNSTFTSQSYTYGWFRNYGAQGLYNEDYGNHWYATGNDYWNLAGNNGSQVGIILRTGGHQGTVRGYVYADSSNNVGFLSNGGGWRLRVVSGDYSLADGSSMRAQLYYDSNDTGYYSDQAGTSRLNYIDTNDGNLQLYKSQTVDMSNTSTYSTSNYYPVTIGVPTGGVWIEIQNNLNSNVPSWATHGGGFTLNLRWWTNGSGWGTTEVKRRVEQYHERFTNQTICGGITQMGNSSTEVVWLRGGGIYYFYFSRNIGATAQSGTYTSNSQSVSPTSSAQNSVWDSASGSHTSYNNRVDADSQMRSPIFYDNSDTGYYCDPNSTSNLNTLSSATLARHGISAHYTNRPSITGDANYWVGSQGWGDSHTWDNVLNTLGSTFIDLWGTNRQHPQGNGYVHAQGLQALHYRDGSSTSYGWQMVGAADADSRWWLRGKWGTTYRSWYEIVLYGRNVGGDLYANIMYDSNDTGYYCDPASTNRLNFVNSNNHYIQPGYMLYSDHGSWQGEYNKIQWHSSHLYLQNNGGGYLLILRRGDGGERFYCDYSGNVTASGNITAYSDQRLKTNIETIANPLELVNKLRGVTFDWIETGKHSYGLIAQEVEQVIPELVLETTNGNTETDISTTVKSVDYSKLVSVLIEAVKEQQQQIDKLTKLVEALLAK